MLLSISTGPNIRIISGKSNFLHIIKAPLVLMGVVFNLINGVYPVRDNSGVTSECSVAI